MMAGLALVQLAAYTASQRGEARAPPAATPSFLRASPHIPLSPPPCTASLAAFKPSNPPKNPQKPSNPPKTLRSSGTPATTSA
jgi:hypothetical protein